MVQEEAQAFRWTPGVRKRWGENRRPGVQQAATEGLRSEPQETVLQTARQAETKSTGEDGEAEKGVIHPLRDDSRQNNPFNFITMKIKYVIDSITFMASHDLF